MTKFKTYSAGILSALFLFAPVSLQAMEEEIAFTSEEQTVVNAIEDAMDAVLEQATMPGTYAVTLTTCLNIKCQTASQTYEVGDKTFKPVLVEVAKDENVLLVEMFDAAFKIIEQCTVPGEHEVNLELVPPSGKKYTLFASRTVKPLN